MIRIGQHTFEFPERVYSELAPYLVHTPCMKGQYFDRTASADILFKCENFQKTGSFKFRGALYAVKQYVRRKKPSVVCTHSSGNFGGALARACFLEGVRCFVVVPENAPEVKKKAMSGYGAELQLCKPGTVHREKALMDYLKNQPEAVFIHPFNDPHVVEGHTTLITECFRDGYQPDCIVVPVGGGGLISGISLAASYYFPSTKVIGAEPENASDAFLSLQKGEIIHLNEVNTVADGLKTPLGPLTFDIIRQKVHRIFTVDEDEILLAQKEIMHRLKILCEPSSAVVWAAVKKNKHFFENKKILLLISGGNMDI